MNKIIVNKLFITDLIKSSLCFYDMDEIEAIFSELEVDNEEEMKKVIRYFLLITYYLKEEEYQKIFKDSLMYCLSTEDCNFERLFYDAMPAIECTSVPKTFFIWVWEVFYRYDDYIIEKNELANYIEKNDLRMLNKFK